MPWVNKLYFGDNLDIMRNYIPDESVDLIYLDPPFNSKATYNVLFGEANGTQSAAQITAFEDTWHWDIRSEDTYRELVTEGPQRLSNLVQAFRSFLGQNDMMAYLVMMAIRLIEMHRVLKQTGSIYLHCDPTASHYLKLAMDAVWGIQYFQNEIIWERFGAHNDPNRFGRVTDTILFYSKTQDYNFNPIRTAYKEKHISSRFRYLDPDGRKFWPNTCLAPGGRGPMYDWNGHVRNWRFTEIKMRDLHENHELYYSKSGMPYRKNYLDSLPGQLVQNIWTDIKMTKSGSERLGYPTQKPEALLERIIKASSNEGDIVLDPFCGCGTSIAVAERLNRRWIGVDVTHLAITLMKHRLEDAFGSSLSPYEVYGDPQDLPGAAALAEHDKYQFEWWALGKVAARPSHDRKKGADSGVDGYIYFFDDNSGKAKKIVVQVKGGGVTSSQVRDLIGVMQREDAVIGLFLTLNEPTKAMVKEAAAAGFYTPEYLPGSYPKLQIITVKELLAGAAPLYPKLALATFSKARPKNKSQSEQIDFYTTE